MIHTFSNSKLDQHLMPIYLLCNPCAVNYTFYGNVHSLTNDIHQALQEVGAPEWLYKERIEHSKLSVSDMMELYFGQLSPKERTRLKEEFKRKTGYSFEAAPKVEYVNRLCTPSVCACVFVCVCV